MARTTAKKTAVGRTQKRVPPTQRGLTQNNPANIAASEEARHQSWNLFKAGMTYRQIGAELGIDHTTAWNHVQSVMQEMRRETAMSAQDYADVQHAQIVDMHRMLTLDFLSAKDAEARVNITYAIKALMERDAKLLGYDAGSKMGLDFLDELNRANARRLNLPEDEAVRLGRQIYEMSKGDDGSYA